MSIVFLDQVAIIRTKNRVFVSPKIEGSYKTQLMNRSKTRKWEISVSQTDQNPLGGQNYKIKCLHLSPISLSPRCNKPALICDFGGYFQPPVDKPHTLNNPLRLKVGFEQTILMLVNELWFVYSRLKVARIILNRRWWTGTLWSTNY